MKHLSLMRIVGCLSFGFKELDSQPKVVKAASSTEESGLYTMTETFPLESAL